MTTTLAPISQIDERSAWLETRRKFIGGSDCASMFNAGYGCHRRLVMDKRGVPDDYGHQQKTLDLFERGHELEDIIADKFLRSANKILERKQLPPISMRKQSARLAKDAPWMGVNMDRQLISVTQEALLAISPEFSDRIGPNPGPGVLECKSANQWVFRRVMMEGLQDDYILQMQHSLAVTGYEWGIFAVLEPSSWQFIWFAVVRDEQLISSIADRAALTWATVTDSTAPLPPKLDIRDKRCGNCTKRKTCRGEELVAITVNDSDEEDDAKSDASVYEVDDSLSTLASDYAFADERVTETEQIRDWVKGELQKAIGARSRVEVPSAGVRILYKQQKEGVVVDSAAVKSEIPRLLGEFLTLANEMKVAGVSMEFVKKFSDRCVNFLNTDRFFKPKKGARPLRIYWI